MRRYLAALCLVLIAACASPSAPQPSASILSMRDRFETEVLGVEQNYAGNPEGLRMQGAAIALRIYGADWPVVRAEASRSLAALPKIDLAPYAALPESAKLQPATSFTDNTADIAPFLTPAGLAMMRFWDAQAVGSFTASVSVLPDLANDNAAMLGVKLGLVPTRVYRGSFNGADVLATRYFRTMVIAPYSITTEGLILPDFAHIAVYPLQH